jgi:hypothetical protein
VRKLALATLLLTAVSCGGSPDPTEERGSELADLTLRDHDAPAGMELDEDSSGPMGSVRDVLPPATDVPHLPRLAKEARRSFEAGYDAVYRAETQEAPAEVSSSVVRFGDATSAGAFLDYLHEVQTSEVTVGSSRAQIEEVAAPSMGEEGYAFHRSTPGGETSGCSWRRGELVFTLTLTGSLGEASAERALELGRLVDERAG